MQPMKLHNHSWRRHAKIQISNFSSQIKHRKNCECYHHHCGYRSHKLTSVGRKEGVCLSDQPSLHSDTLVTGLAAASCKLCYLAPVLDFRGKLDQSMQCRLIMYASRNISARICESWSLTGGIWSLVHSLHQINLHFLPFLPQQVL